MLKSLLKNKLCLVTGGKGFIGAHLTEELLSCNSSVLVLDKEPIEITSYFTIEGLPARVEYVQGDITVSNQVSKILRKYDVDYVFHLAAQPITPLSNLEPNETMRTNVEGTRNICEAILKQKKKAKLIFASSACYYGLALNSPLRESDPPNLGLGHSVYTKSKIHAEQIIHDFHKKQQLESIICRFVNVYGPGDRHGSRIIPKTIIALLNDKIPELARSFGDSVFSFMFVKDAVRAFLCAAMNVAYYSGEVFNFGLLGDNPRSIKKLIQTIFQISGKKAVTPTITCSIPEPRVVKYLDPSKSIRCLGWLPAIDLEIGLTETMSWEKLHGNKIERFLY